MPINKYLPQDNTRVLWIQKGNKHPWKDIKNNLQKSNNPARTWGKVEDVNKNVTLARSQLSQYGTNSLNKVAKHLNEKDIY